jgi:hypothetical protein
MLTLSQIVYACTPHAFKKNYGKSICCTVTIKSRHKVAKYVIAHSVKKTKNKIKNRKKTKYVKNSTVYHRHRILLPDERGKTLCKRPKETVSSFRPRIFHYQRRQFLRLDHVFSIGKCYLYSRMF